MDEKSFSAMSTQNTTQRTVIGIGYDFHRNSGTGRSPSFMCGRIQTAVALRSCFTTELNVGCVRHVIQPILHLVSHGMRTRDFSVTIQTTINTSVVIITVIMYWKCL
jgi:hypothetical protein